MLNLIYNSIQKRKLQSAALLFSTAVCISVLFALVIIYRGVSAGINTAEQRLGADVMVIPSAAADVLESSELLFTGAPAPIYMQADVVERVRELADVDAVTTQFFGQTLSEPCCSPSSTVRLVGFDPDSDWVVTPWLLEKLDHELGANEIIIGSDVTGFEDGYGRIRGQEVTVAGVLGTTDTSMDMCVFMDIHVLQELIAETEDFAASRKLYGEAEDLVSTILIKAKEGRANAVSLKLRTMGDFKIITTAGVLSDVQKQMDIVFVILLSAAVLMCIGTVLQLFGRFYSMTWERRNELGLYRALGASEAYLRKLLLGEMLFFIGGGTLAGAALGYCFYKLLLMFLNQSTAFPFARPTGGFMLILTVVGLLFFTLVGLLAMIVPLSQTSKVDPVAAMQRKDID